MKRQKAFSFFNTEKEARDFEKSLPRHLRGPVTPWSSSDGTEHKYVAWYKQ